MPVRSLSSSVLKWPNKQAVDQAVRAWAIKMAGERKEILRIGYFGSYARDDWGVGSDLDIIIILERSDLPFTRRASEWDASGLPVPADLLVYTEDEWRSMNDQGIFFRIVMKEAVWVYERGYSR